MPKSGPPSDRLVRASLALAILLPSLGTSIANVGLPAIARAHAASFHAIQWVVLAYLVAVTGLVVVAGRLGDRFGRRRLLLGGITLFTGASLLCAVAPTLELLVAARALQGAGAAMMMALTMAFVGETVPKENTGSVMGLLGGMSAVGTALGPSLGGMLIAGFGWRALFLVKVPLGLLTLLLARRCLPADRPVAPAGPARQGVVPLIRRALFGDPLLRAGLVSSALVATVIMATLVVGPFYLSRSLGLEPATVGLVMSMGPLVAALTGPLAGRSVDRLGAARMSLAGLATIAAGALLLALLPSSLGVGGYVGPIAFITAGYALFQTANNTGVMTRAAAEQRGLVSGMLNLSRNLGLIAGASVMGAVFALGAGADDVATAAPGAVASGMRVTFAVAGLLVLSALAITRQGPARMPLAPVRLRSNP